VVNARLNALLFNTTQIAVPPTPHSERGLRKDSRYLNNQYSGTGRKTMVRSPQVSYIGKRGPGHQAERLRAGHQASLGVLGLLCQTTSPYLHQAWG